MTTKEIAKELYLKMLKYQHQSNLYIERNIICPPAKDCALVAVDLIIYHTEQDSSNIPLYEIYLDVKKEIEKL
jgi:hypothetical protein